LGNHTTESAAECIWREEKRQQGSPSRLRVNRTPDIREKEKSQQVLLGFAKGLQVDAELLALFVEVAAF
jgi:hypothetical protein